MRRRNLAFSAAVVVLLLLGALSPFRRAFKDAGLAAIELAHSRSPVASRNPAPIEEPDTFIEEKKPDSRINATLCQYNECLKGRWVPRDPQFKSLAEFQEVFATRGATKWDRCAVASPPPGTNRTPEETEELEHQRIVDIMNWVWRPDRGIHIPWDPLDFVVRLLKTPGGLILMGDSLSQGHDHAFGSYLEEAGIRFDTNPSHLPKDSSINTHVLIPGHPMTLELQKRAGVPDSRLLYPIFSIVEEHIVVTQAELRFLTGLHGAQEGWGWYLDTLRRTDDWDAFFRWVTKPRPGEEDSVTRDTLLVFNTGAHWSRGTMYMMPELGSLVRERSELTRMYKTMAKMMIQKFSVHPRLTVFYRATNPGHASCQLHNRPYVDAAEAYKVEHDGFLELVDASASSAEDRKIRRRWDWDLFNVHNHIWRKEIQFLQWERKKLQELYPGNATALGPKWLFADVYEMALQRPDAHAVPGKDCLHWCLPAMYPEWSRHLYHMLYLEMEQEGS